jgi:AAHS family 4-hydroxybenzoate transporter-like MFS transporter
LSAPQVARDVDISQLIDEAPLSAFQARIVALCALASFLDGYDVQALGLAVPRMAETFAVAPTAFAPALSGSLVGMAGGAMLLAPLGDKFGRRPMMIALMSLIGLSTLGVMLAHNLVVLTGWRVLTGVAIGAAVPIAVAMTSEYTPVRLRAGLITVVIAAMALGSFAAGIVAPIVDGLWGWRGIFAVGAVLPLVLAAMLWAAFPESLRFLIARGHKPEEVLRQVRRIAPGGADIVPVASAPAHVAKASLGALFSPLYRFRTTLLWVILWFNLFAAYSLISWLPTLLHSAGWATADAQRATGLVALGGIAGGLCMSWIADRGHAIKTLVGAYMATAFLLGMITTGPGNVAVWTSLLTLVGAGAFGAQMALISISAAHYYPPELRSTGVGWYSGVGRFGAIVGPLALAELMKAGWASGPILGFLIIPMLVCAGGVLLIPRAMAAR